MIPIKALHSGLPLLTASAIASSRAARVIDVRLPAAWSLLFGLTSRRSSCKTHFEWSPIHVLPRISSFSFLAICNRDHAAQSAVISKDRAALLMLFWQPAFGRRRQTSWSSKVAEQAKDQPSQYLNQVCTLLWSANIHNWDIGRTHLSILLTNITSVRRERMPEIRNRYFQADHVDPARHTIASRSVKNRRVLRYSSPWPWIFAIAIALIVWISFAGVIWEYWR
jgi:hypothetical protein